MAETHETIADVIAEMHRFAEQHEYDHPDMDANAQGIRDYADRLEVAHKHERGDAAKLREALEKCANWGEQIDCQLGSSDETVYAFRDERCLAHNISECARAALSAQPRNCDVPLVVDGPADNNADKAWLVFKQHNPDAYFDVPGLLRCIDWLLAPATEKKGGNDGNE